MDPHLEKNRKPWGELVHVHARSEFHDVEGFKRGRSSLMAIEIELPFSLPASSPSR